METNNQNNHKQQQQSTYNLKSKYIAKPQLNQK